MVMPNYIFQMRIIFFYIFSITDYLFSQINSKQEIQSGYETKRPLKPVTLQSCYNGSVSIHIYWARYYLSWYSSYYPENTV
jgi:hypothetical protein